MTVRWSNTTIGLAIAAGVLVVVVGAFGMLLATPTPAATNSVQVDLTIAQDPVTGSYAFSPSVLHVPAGAMIELRITNYDPSIHSVDPVYCNVSGTSNGVMEEMGFGMGSMMGHMMRGLAAGAVSHTFTMMSNGWDLNVPIPPAVSAQTPSITEVSFQTHGPGAASWMCEGTMNGAASPMMGTFETS